MKAVLAGGGTAGHVNPLLSVAQELRRRDPAVELVVLGTAQGLESRLVPEAGLELVTLPKAAFPRRPGPAALRFPRDFRRAVAVARGAIERLGADVVVGFGGYVATPAYLAAHRAGTPIVVHEANSRPGLANRLGARWAGAVAVTFPETRLPGAIVTGLPLRPALAGLDRAAARAGALAELGLEPGRPVLLVTGGSLGAQHLNETVAAVAAEVVAAGWQVLHLTGAGKAQAVRDGAPREHYHVLEYLDRMELAYAAADLVVCRSGAGTVAELAAVGLPSVLVPLPIGNGEQALNGRGLVRAGGALMIEDHAFTPDWARADLLGLVRAPERLAQMAAAASGAGIRDGASRVADLVERCARGAAA
ncbi:MAG: undecaprenyldiphospho-muramoylpentapeptide beta-N-acetylglucosaminyltransferase [Bifidobacteriaceae bacterium]|jgi:undecaprenyldiphospho-muramoylpentapeptide beta-N-acetylglucosaminyltransferase|nr:undecaprenyldiphospho-muramoylpentapeptide beta-N-acetylglucosaminyltransferase [Bifidobacteriaceae bacterium]